MNSLIYSKPEIFSFTGGYHYGKCDGIMRRIMIVFEGFEKIFKKYSCFVLCVLILNLQFNIFSMIFQFFFCKFEVSAVAILLFGS